MKKELFVIISESELRSIIIDTLRSNGYEPSFVNDSLEFISYLPDNSVKIKIEIKDNL